MSDKKNTTSKGDKNALHPRNPHREGYDFTSLIKSHPGLEPFVFTNNHNQQTLDFSDAEAVKALNTALLKQYYNITSWEIPQGYLVPPVPGRADYIHYAADLLSSVNRRVIPTGPTMKILDVGVGANCIFPIIGIKEYGWHFVGIDIDKKALQSAAKIVASNKILTEAIELRRQEKTSHIIKGIIGEMDEFDLVMCNPPFHSDMTEVEAAATRKWNNLKIENGNKPLLNFSGKESELIYPGGEEAFVMKFIHEASLVKKKCYWFTTLISKEDNLLPLTNALKKAGALNITVVNMAQGQKQSRFLAWTFLNEIEQRNWRERHWWE